MIKKENNSLGKGLSALISSDKMSAFVENIDKDKLIYVDINNVIPNVNQPRKMFSEFELLELAESIKMHGILQPLIVSKDNDNYKLIAGERRLKAAKSAGLEIVPVIIHNLDDAHSLEIALIENIQRENLNTIEEALAYKNLMDDFNYTQEQLGTRLNKSRSHVANMLRILSLSENIQQKILNNKLTFGHAKVLANAENADFVADKIIESNLSVRDAEKLVRMQKIPFNGPNNQNEKYERKIMPRMAHDKIEKDQELTNIEQLLTTTLKMPVEIVESLEGAKLQINFTTLQQLDYLIELLTNK